MKNIVNQSGSTMKSIQVTTAINTKENTMTTRKFNQTPE